MRRLLGLSLLALFAAGPAFAAPKDKTKKEAEENDRQAEEQAKKEAEEKANQE